MEEKKLRIGILCGGKSAEHEISLISAKSVIEALDKSKYDIHIIGIDKNGAWHLRDNALYLMHDEDPKRIHLYGDKQTVALIPFDECQLIKSYSGNQLRETLDLDSLDYIDLVVVIESNFPIKVKPEDFVNILTFQDFYDYVIYNGKTEPA